MNNLVKFCTNCGTKLDDEDIFCTNCGQNTKDYKKTNINKKEVKQAKKILKEYYGGLKIKDSYKEKLTENINQYNIKRINSKEMLSIVINGGEIKEKIWKEIYMKLIEKII